MTTMISSLDGTRLACDVHLPPQAARSVVLVHGGGVDRHEGGFFDRLARDLVAGGVACLQVDLRGHGESDGRREDLTLAAVGNDVRAAVLHLASQVGSGGSAVVGASFSGGVCAMLAARHPDLIDRLVLFNPLLDYKKRFVDEKDYWHEDVLDAAMAVRLAADGSLAHSPTFPLGAALLNEVFWWDVRAALPNVAAPTLVVHGTRDTFIPVESSRAAVATLRCPHRLVELDGAQHGLAEPDDPTYQHPRTQARHAEVSAEVLRWLTP